MWGGRQEVESRQVGGCQIIEDLFVQTSMSLRMYHHFRVGVREWFVENY